MPPLALLVQSLCGDPLTDQRPVHDNRPSPRRVVRLGDEHVLPGLAGVMAWEGTTTASPSVISVSTTSTDCPGHRRWSSLANAPFSRIVARVAADEAQQAAGRRLTVARHGSPHSQRPGAHVPGDRGQVLSRHGATWSYAIG